MTEIPKLLSQEQTDRAHVAAGEFIKKLLDITEAPEIAEPGWAYLVGCVGVQTLLGPFTEMSDGVLFYPALQGAAEGLGSAIATVVDDTSRAGLLAQAVWTLGEAVRRNSAIHSPANDMPA